MNRVGDMGLSIGYFALFAFFGSLDRDFLLGHSSKCHLPTRPYAGPLLITDNLLRHFSVLERAHGPTYYFGPLPLQ